MILIQSDRSISDLFYEENVKYSLDNGATWYGEDEIRWALSLLSNITPKELEEALEAKSKSCENCIFYFDHINAPLEICMEEQGDFSCSKHEPKIIKALEK